MLIKFGLIRLAIISLFVIIFPLIQNQWLNLYLFDLNKLTFYKILYYLSGIICPIFVILNSLSMFTNYQFSNKRIIKTKEVSGKLLLITTAILLITLSTLISNHIFISFNIFLNLNNIDIKNLFFVEIDKHFIYILIISILLILKKSKLLIKKFVLINFFLTTIILWFSQLNNLFINDSFLIKNIFKFEQINYINILSLLSIEVVYYLWSYISYGSFLSDWRLPKPELKDILPLLTIIFFYLLIVLYYSLLF